MPPADVPPCFVFETHAAKGSNGGEAQRFVQADAAGIGQRYARIRVDIVLCDKRIKQRRVKPAAVAYL